MHRTARVQSVDCIASSALLRLPATQLYGHISRAVATNRAPTKKEGP